MGEIKWPSILKKIINETTYKIGNATVTISDEFIPKDIEGMRRNLKRFYDVCNKIARNLEARGVNTSNLFYTEEELEEMRKSDEYTFI